VVAVADRIAVDADVLIGHATRVEQVSDDVRAAADTTGCSPLEPGALGPVCSFVLAPTQDATAAVRATLTAAAAMVEWTGQRARAWARQTTDLEQQALDALRGLHADIT